MKPDPKATTPPFETLLAELASALERDGSARELTQLESANLEDPELAHRLERALSCLRLIDRVRRTQPDSLDTSSLLDADERSSTNPKTADADPLAPAPAPQPDKELSCADPDDNGQLAPEAGRAAAEPTPTIHTIGRFTIERELGRGGSGVVFLAIDPQLNREVALKVPRPEALLTPALRARFLREAQAAGGLNHAHIVPVFESGHSGGISYIASAYCPGVSLAQWLSAQSSPPSEQTTADVIQKLAEAVQHAHARGILHRDLKPSNILLDTGRLADASQPNDSGANDSGAKILGARNFGPRDSDADSEPERLNPRITDFGLARAIEGDEPGASFTQSGAIVGTPAYMAPEQAAGGGRAIGPAADVYALGAILYEMLTGQSPFSRESIAATLRAVADEDPLAPHRVRPGVSADLEAICLKCLEKNPHDRYDSASALSEDLQRFANREPVHARRLTTFERLARWGRRRPAAAALVLVSCAALVALVGLGSWSAARMSFLGEIASAAKHARRAAEGREASERDAKNLHRFYSLLNGVKEQRSAQRPGWTWRALDQLATAAQLAPAAENQPELRSEFVAAQLAIDLRLKRTLGKRIAAHCLAWSPDGKHLALGEFQGTTAIRVHVLDSSTGQTVEQLSFAPDVVYLVGSGHLDGVRSLAYSADGKRLATGTKSGQIFVWRLGAGTQPAVLTHRWKAHQDFVTQLAFAANGDVVSVSLDRTVKRWAFSPTGRAPRLTAEFGPERLVWKSVSLPTPGREAEPDDPKTNAVVVGDWAVIGACTAHLPGATEAGVAHVFHRSPTDGWRLVQQLGAPIAQDKARFGVSVAMDKDLLAIGADYWGPPKATPQPNAGAVFLFARDSSSGTERWRQIEQLTSATPRYGERFGASLALEGDTLAVGVRHGNPHQEKSGSVEVFRRQTTGMRRATSSRKTDSKPATRWRMIQELTPERPSERDSYGTSLALQGPHLVVGAMGADQAGRDAGAVFVYHRESPDQWSAKGVLTASQAHPGELFGVSVALDEETLVAGAVNGRLDGRAVGAAYVFDWNPADRQWRETQRLVPRARDRVNRFGWSLSVRGERITVGAYGRKENSRSWTYRRAEKAAAPWKLMHPLGERLAGPVTLCDDGESLLCACSHGASRLFVSSSQSVVPLQSLSLTGNRIAIDSRPDRVLDADSLQPVSSEPLLEGATCVALSPNAKLVASGDAKGRIFLASADTLLTRKVLTYRAPAPAHEGLVRRLQFSPDGSLLVSAASDQRLCLWEVASGRRLLSLLIGGNSSIHPAFRPDGRQLAVTAGRETRIYDVGGTAAMMFPAFSDAPVRAFVVAPDGDRVAWIAGDASSSVVSQTRLSSNVRGRSHRLRRALGTAPQLAHHPAKDLLAVSTAAENRVVIWGYARKQQQMLEIPQSRTLAFDPRGRLWVTHPPGHQRSRAFSLRAYSLQDLADKKVDRPPSVASWTNLTAQIRLGYSDLYQLDLGESLAAVAAREGAGILLSSDDMQERGRYVAPGRGRVESVALNPQESHLAIGTDHGQVALFRIADRQRTAVLDAHSDRCTSLHFSRDGRLLLTSSSDGSLRVWSVTTNGVLRGLFTARYANRPIVRSRFAAGDSQILLLLEDDLALRALNLAGLRERLTAIGLDW